MLGTHINANGFEVDGWDDFFSCWAEIKKVGWREFYAAKALNAENTITFIIRYSPKTKEMLDDKNPTKKYSIVYKEKRYNILFISNINMENNFIEIKAEGSDK